VKTISYSILPVFTLDDDVSKRPLRAGLPSLHSTSMEKDEDVAGDINIP
jgi:hypothetical protein